MVVTGAGGAGLGLHSGGLVGDLHARCARFGRDLDDPARRQRAGDRRQLRQRRQRPGGDRRRQCRQQHRHRAVRDRRPRAPDGGLRRHRRRHRRRSARRDGDRAGRDRRDRPSASARSCSIRPATAIRTTRPIRRATSSSRPARTVCSRPPPAERWRATTSRWRSTARPTTVELRRRRSASTAARRSRTGSSGCSSAARSRTSTAIRSTATATAPRATTSSATSGCGSPTRSIGRTSTSRPTSTPGP